MWLVRTRFPFGRFSTPIIPCQVEMPALSEFVRFSSMESTAAPVTGSRRENRCTSKLPVFCRSLSIAHCWKGVNAFGIPENNLNVAGCWPDDGKHGLLACPPTTGSHIQSNLTATEFPFRKRLFGPSDSAIRTVTPGSGLCVDTPQQSDPVPRS